MAQALFDTDLGTNQLAYLRDGGRDDFGPCGFFWLGGFRSDMRGKKAEALAEMARTTRRPALRFDYSGHGESSGLFIDGSISEWLEQSVHMFLSRCKGKSVIIGSSMGGWLALLLAKRLQIEDQTAFRRIAAMVLIAPATDMTQDLMWDYLDRGQKLMLRETGVYMRPSEYGEPYPITAKLLADGQQHILLPLGLDTPFPLRIIQGTDDRDVPAAHAMKTMEALRGPDISLTLVKGGDHRLSTPAQLTLIKETALRLAERADGISL